MELILTILEVATLVATGLVAGILYIFSNTVMKALDTLPVGQGANAMRSINRIILNPSFFFVFIGSLPLHIATVSLHYALNGMAGIHFQFTAAVFYLIGVFLVTASRNIPLNDRLDKAEGADFWDEYLRRWLPWNHFRTACCIASLIFASLA